MGCFCLLNCRPIIGLEFGTCRVRVRLGGGWGGSVLVATPDSVRSTFIELQLLGLGFGLGLELSLGSGFGGDWNLQNGAAVRVTGVRVRVGARVRVRFKSGFDLWLQLGGLGLEGLRVRGFQG